MREELAELWRFRYLLQMLIAREIKVRYKNSALGFVWSIVPPLMSVLVITFLFRGALGRDIHNYSAYLLCGIIPWTFFQTTVLETSQSLLHNYGIMKKIYMPREVIPLAIVCSNFIHFLLGWGVYFLIFLVVLPLLHRGGTPLLPGMLWFPVIVLAELFLAIGCALWSSALNMFYEDVKFILQTLFGLVYFLFPILYTADIIRYSSKFRAHPWLFDLYMLNPISAIITAFRESLLQPVPPQDFNPKLANLPPVMISWQIYAGALFLSLLIAWSGYAYFNSRKWKFVERS